MNQDSAQGFILACSSRTRHFPNRTLFLVDRGKNQNIWWKPDLSEALVFTCRESAELVKSRLKFNHPRVIPYSVAVKIAEEQKRRVQPEVAKKKLTKGGSYQYSLPLPVPPGQPTPLNRTFGKG